MPLLLALIQLVALVVLLVRLMPGRRRRPPVAPCAATPSERATVSILVATLDEAHRIAPCLDGLLAQDHVVREILVIDSGSTDGTADLVRDAASRDARVRLLREPPLPAGWVGKVWALEFGLRAASGEWVLGIDADTVPQPGLAGGAVRAARSLTYDAVSFAPRFRIDSPAERWLQPALLVTLIYRFGATGTDPDPERLLANGQCFLARREALLQAGGYASARSSFCDDVTLARHLARAGRRVGFLDGSRLYDVRAYTSAREAWREWGRSLDLKDATSRTRQWYDVLFLLVAQGTPVLALIICTALLASGHSAWASVAPLVTTSGALLAVRVMLQRALAPSYHETGAAFWLSPLADPLAALRILLSTVRTPTRWRGRSYAGLREA